MVLSRRPVVRYGRLDPRDLPAFLHERAAMVDEQFNAADIRMLEADVLEHSFRNPICAITTDSGLEVPYGHQRAVVAIRLQWPIPTIVTDRHNRYPTWEVLEDELAARKKFWTQPRVFNWTADGLMFGMCPWPGGAGKSSQW